MNQVSIADFGRLDIRIGKVIAVEKVPETDRLLKFEFDLGEEKRTIVGGWALAYPDPSGLVGTLMPVITNLEPRTIRGIESQGMILGATRKMPSSSEDILGATKDDQPVALHPDQEVEPGSQVR